ncbi:DUF803-domain-containing protein [Aaosphaeria arxii CBS 175.79]|uniref:DUF803-domain-containing protein n=1 Tax=Aaosphaeria arxii CBS 175.79 TaxID=1450172 RepID=A0A6A5XIS8_9PLEO|nr:DUF803-domain-containing protein [Aaosphaeria arxii CBS 175.79]KAF2012680.1 DUF803-domain-containing protein [Aaosphaeria arxii CBS 175.79]
MLLPSPYDTTSALLHAAGPASSTTSLPTTTLLSSTTIPLFSHTPHNGTGGGGGGGTGHLNPENWSSLIGIITAIVGNILISFALNMQRYAHIRIEREWQAKEKLRKKRRRSRNSSRSKIRKRYRDAGIVEEDEDEEEGGNEVTERAPLLGGRTRTRSSKSGESGDGEEEEAYKQTSYLKSPYWWAGIIMMTTGEAGNFLAYGFAPASIVSPLGVVALISNCIIAPFMLKEPFRLRDALGVLVAVGGAVTVVLSASDNNPKLGPDEIWGLITTWEFETYLGVTAAVIVILSVLSNRYGEKNILIDLGLVGLFGGYTALSTKGVASMLSYTLWRAITFPVTYLMVATLVFTAVMQIKYINRALQRFDATQVIPVQFVLFTLSVILGSAILYRDFERTSGGDAGKFVGGCALTFMGVWLITSGRTRRNDDEEDDDREPEPDYSINLMEERYHDELDDGDAHKAGTSSRRTSTVRASSPPIDIARSNSTFSSQHPSRNNSTDGQANIQFTPATPSPSTPPPHATNPWTPPPRTPPGRPSTGSGIRPAPPSSFLSNRASTYSTPVLPSEAILPQATTSTPTLPLTSTTPSPLPQTPTRGTSDPHLTTTTPSTLPPRLRRGDTAERLLTLSSSALNNPRSSIPGPLLASPLSASLATMVADLKRNSSLRTPTTPGPSSSFSTRRRESVLGIGAGEIDENAMCDSPLERRRTATDDVPSNTATRKRSLSGTLGELWRGIRREIGTGDVVEDEESGGRR